MLGARNPYLGNRIFELFPQTESSMLPRAGEQRTFHTFSRRIGILFPSTTTIGKRMRLEGMNTRH